MIHAQPPRLPPLLKERWGEDVQAALRAAFPKIADRFFSTAPDAMRMPNAISTMMHHPALTGPFLTYNRVLLEKPVLGHRLRELMVLRVAWRTRSSYEWVQHLLLAQQRYSVTPEDIDAITRGTPAKSWTPLEVDLIAATDQLLDRHRVADDTWARLAEQLDPRQLVEVVFTVGTYTCLAMAFNSFGLQLDPEIDTSKVIPFPASEE